MTARTLQIKLWPTGPKFPLPSLDAECLAVIAYFKYLASRHDSVVVAVFEPCWDASQSPTGSLPCMKCACDSEVGGAVSIFRHLRSCTAVESDADLDSWTSDDQQADCTAWTSLVLSRATTILDLYLYLTPDNYSTTRSAYTTFLPLYANYTIPPAHHKAASMRSSHLSVASLLSSNDDHEHQQTATSATALGPGKFSFGSSSTAFRGMAAKTNRRISLEKVVGSLCEPLQELLDGKKYLLDHSKASSLDALAIGFLALLRSTDLSDSWAKDILKSKYPALDSWAQRQTSVVFGLDDKSEHRISAS